MARNEGSLNGNQKQKVDIDFPERQKWLTEYYCAHAELAVLDQS